MKPLLLCLLSALFSEASRASPRSTPVDRKLTGEALDYGRIGGDVRPRTREEERRLSWEIARRVVAPVKLKSGITLPLFQTWYGKDDLSRIMGQVLKTQGPLSIPSTLVAQKEIVQEAFRWNETSAALFRSWDPKAFEERRRLMLEDPTVASAINSEQRVLFSPKLAAHLIANYPSVIRCLREAGKIPSPHEDLEASENFSPCIGTEAPFGSVVVKARWVQDEGQVQKVPTDVDAVGSQVTGGTWIGSEKLHIPAGTAHGAKDPVTGKVKKLLALHIAVKETRDWVWITLWWAPDKNHFGEDKPQDFPGAWRNYEMCSVTGYKALPYEKRDSVRALAEAAIDRETQGDSWCSNPYIEVEPGNARSNCIGCHQHGGSEATDVSRHGRGKVRRNFPSDYLWSMNHGIEVGTMFRGWVENLGF